eukprot:7389987-Prymnesium_polylepis.1
MDCDSNESEGEGELGEGEGELGEGSDVAAEGSGGEGGPREDGVGLQSGDEDIAAERVGLPTQQDRQRAASLLRRMQRESQPSAQVGRLAASSPSTQARAATEALEVSSSSDSEDGAGGERCMRRVGEEPEDPELMAAHLALRRGRAYA